MNQIPRNATVFRHWNTWPVLGHRNSAVYYVADIPLVSLTSESGRGQVSHKRDSADIQIFGRRRRRQDRSLTTWEIATRNLITQLNSSPFPIMADVKKQEKDFTKEVDQLIPEAETVARVSFGGPSILRATF